jgi:hypothetical protein
MKCIIVLVVFFVFNMDVAFARGARKPLFEISDLQAMRIQATNYTDTHIASLSPEQLEKEALAYFADSSTNNDDLIPAYRTEMIMNGLYGIAKNKYPTKILSSPKWAWNNVGHVYARILILYCSLDEYLSMWGTSLAQNGFSGYYPKSEYYDIMMTGKMVSNDASSDHALPKTYVPGDVSLLAKKETRFYEMDKFTYMMDYGRGDIPGDLWEGVIAPFLFANQDSPSIIQQLKDCGSSVIHHP